MFSASQPLNVVCAIIRREDGRVLLAQRPPGKSLAGLWEFPGGKIDPGETPLQALHREILEELGCHVTVIQSGPPALHEYSWGFIRLYPFLCKLTACSPPPHPHEHTALRWLFQKNIPLEDLAPADLPVLAWVKNLN
jgi:8-oxo-dGTP diphosphatase